MIQAGTKRASLAQLFARVMMPLVERGGVAQDLRACAWWAMCSPMKLAMK